MLFRSVAIDIRDRYAVAVIVVDGFVALARVIHDAMEEGDSAVFQRVIELKLVEDFELIRGLLLRLLACREFLLNLLHLGFLERIEEDRKSAQQREAAWQKAEQERDAM